MMFSPHTRILTSSAAAAGDILLYITIHDAIRIDNARAKRGGGGIDHKGRATFKGKLQRNNTIHSSASAAAAAATTTKDDVKTALQYSLYHFADGRGRRLFLPPVIYCFYPRRREEVDKWPELINESRGGETSSVALIGKCLGTSLYLWKAGRQVNESCSHDEARVEMLLCQTSHNTWSSTAKTLYVHNLFCIFDCRRWFNQRESNFIGLP